MGFVQHCEFHFLRSFILRLQHRNNLQRKVRARRQLRAQQVERVREWTADLDAETARKIAALGIEELLGSSAFFLPFSSPFRSVEEGRFLMHGCPQDVLPAGTCGHREDELRHGVRSGLFNSLALFISLVRLQEAIAEAKKLDTLAKDPQFEKPRLFGLPISIKANISASSLLPLAFSTRRVQMKGFDVIRGYAQDLEQPSDRDSVLVVALREMGALPFALTNVPVSLLSYSCENAVFGTTSHPLSAERTAGGSSGGEGALVGCGGSLVGGCMERQCPVVACLQASARTSAARFAFRPPSAEWSASR